MSQPSSQIVKHGDRFISTSSVQELQNALRYFNDIAKEDWGTNTAIGSFIQRAAQEYYSRGDDVETEEVMVDARNILMRAKDITADLMREVIRREHLLALVDARRKS